MKLFRLLFALSALLLAGGRPAQAQRFDWGQSLQGVGADIYVETSATDAAGNTYLAASLHDSVLVMAHGRVRRLGSVSDVVLLKISAAGQVRWIRQFANAQVTCLSLSATGALWLSGEADAGQWGTSTLSRGTYLAKLDTAGTLQWARTLRVRATSGRPYWMLWLQLTAGPQGECYATARGYYVRSIDGTALDTSGTVGYAVLRFSAAGTLEWLSSIVAPAGSPSAPPLYLGPLRVTSTGDCLLTWVVAGGTATFGTQPGAPQMQTAQRGLAWYRGQSGAVRRVLLHPWHGVLALDPDDNIYVSGRMDSVAAGGQTHSRLFVGKLDSTGAPLWLRYNGGTTYNAEVPAITCLPGGDVAISGRFDSGPLTFGPYSIPGSARVYTGFVARFSAQGDTRWLERVGNEELDNAAFNLNADAAGNLYLRGALYTAPHAYLTAGPVTLYGPGTYLLRISQQVNRLTGQIYLDANANNQRDPGEAAFPRPVPVIETNQNQPATSDPATGRFTAYAGQGPYDLRLPRVPLHYQLTEGSTGHQGTFVGFVQTDMNLNFGLAPIAGRQDLRVTLTPFRPARRGIPTVYRARVENLGTTTVASGLVRVQLDSAVVLVGTTPPAPVQPHWVEWSFSNLAPFTTRDFDLTLNVPLNVPVGADLTFVAEVAANTGLDVSPADNVDVLRQTVVGSCDPNDISVSYAVLTAAQIAAQTPLDYVVRFQNMGTDTAFAVVIQDTLPAALLQMSTIELLSQSHSVQWSLSGLGLLTMRFPGIQLPQRAVDAVRSQGFVRFRIVPRTTLAPGTLIPNRAHIIFDFNAPVTTNDALTLVQMPNGLTAEPGAGDASMRLYPNPADRAGQVTLTAQVPTPGAATVTVLDALGRAVRTETVAAPAGSWTHAVPTAGLAPGVYAVRLTLPGGASTSRRLVVR